MGWRSLPGSQLGYNKRMRSLLIAGFGLALGLATLAAQTPATKPAPTAPKPATPTAPKVATPTAQKPVAPSASAMAISMPPFPSPGFAPPRTVEVTRAIYKFAAEHPEVLKYVPCYCGCESTGHPHNESCFVKRRDAKGNVLEWDTHGYG